MKHTPITPVTEDFPAALHPYLHGRIYDSSSSPEARVYYLEEVGLYLKRGARTALRKEAEMTSFFYKKGLSVEVLAYLSEEEDWLLTRKGIGEDATHPRYLADGRRLAATLGEALRALHETPQAGCPIPCRTADYLQTVEARAAAGFFDPSYLPPGIMLTKEEALACIREAAPHLSSRVLLHGDFCLPNVLLDGWRPSAYIDLGAAGIGDRHIDLFWGAWSLCYNLGTDACRNVFLEAYGRDRAEDELLLAIAAAECFG